MFDKLFESLRYVSLEESRKTAYDKYVASNKLSEEVFNKLLSLDKTKTKKYIDWACEQYMQEKGTEEEIMDLASKFDEAVSKNKIKTKDINALSFEEVKTAVSEAPASKTEQKKSAVVEGSEVVFDSPNVIVYRVDTEKASQILGKGSKWCTSAEKDCAFNTYNKEKLQTGYIVHSKTKKDSAGRPVKFAVWVKPNGDKQAWNAEDKDVPWETMLSTLGISGDEDDGK